MFLFFLLLTTVMEIVGGVLQPVYEHTVHMSNTIPTESFLSSPQANALDLLCYRHGRGPHVCLIHSLTGSVFGLPTH